MRKYSANGQTGRAPEYAPYKAECAESWCCALCLRRVRTATLAWVFAVVSCVQIHNASYSRIVPQIQRARSVVAVAHNYANAVVDAGYNETCGAFGMLLNVAP